MARQPAKTPVQPGPAPTRAIELHADGTLQVQAVAELFGITYQGVVKWLRKGCPIAYAGAPGSANGKRLRLSDVVEWRIASEREAENPDNDDSPDQENAYNYDRERARKTSFQADMAEMEARKLAGQLVEIDAVADVVEIEMGEIRAGLLNLPSRLAVPLSTISDETEIAEYVRQEVTDILERLSAPEAIAQMALTGEDQLTRDDDEAMK